MTSATEASLQIRYPQQGRTRADQAAQLSDRAHLRGQRDAGATRSAWLCPSRKARRFWLSPRLPTSGQRGAQTRRAASTELSEREVEVLRYVACEEVNASIGKTLGLSPKTVGSLRHGIGCRPRSAWWLLPTTMPWSPSSAPASGSRAPPERRQAGALRPPSRLTPATLPSTKHATRNRRREWPNRP